MVGEIERKDMKTRLKDCSKAIRSAIKERAERENELTGYGMELEQVVNSTGNTIICHMTKKLYYEDYTAEIRNQGSYNYLEEHDKPRFYAYGLIITPKKADIAPLTYEISYIMRDYELYGKLPTWERLHSFIESDELKQLFVKAYEIQTKFLADIKADFGVEDENS